MSVNVHVPSAPAHLKITQTMWEDFLCDPVLAVYCIFNGLQLDAFQAARLRYFWWVANVMDSSGYSSGKTIVDFLFANLRAILIPDQRVGVYYPTFDTGKNAFWPYFQQMAGRSPIFKAQLGGVDDPNDKVNAGRIESGGFYKAEYRNGNNLLMPAPSVMKDSASQASMRFNTLMIDEWPSIDASSNAIDAQLVGRASRQNWSQHHPLWGNHILLTAPAKTRMHPACARYKSYLAKVKKGHPNFACLHYSFKDFSNLPGPDGKNMRDNFRDMNNIELRKATMGAAEWLADGYGIWSASGKGWFTEEILLNCVEAAKRRKVRPVTSRAEMEELVQAQNN